MTKSFPKRGDIWLANLNPAKGREQSGISPALVISDDNFNRSLAELIIVIPISTKKKNIPLHIEIQPPNGGIKEISYIKCEDIKSISKERLIVRWGALSNDIITEVEKIVKIILSLV